jgi:hypothetical protein
VAKPGRDHPWAYNQSRAKLGDRTGLGSRRKLTKSMAEGIREAAASGSSEEELMRCYQISKTLLRRVLDMKCYL